MKGLTLAITLAVSVSAVADESMVRSMGFKHRLHEIRYTATRLGVGPKNIAETTDLMIVRFVTSNGSTLLTCSRLDHKMVITRLPYQPGLQAPSTP